MAEKQTEQHLESYNATQEALNSNNPSTFDFKETKASLGVESTNSIEANVKEIIKNNKKSIENAAKEFGVDKYIIAAVIYKEQKDLGRGENARDEALARAHKNIMGYSSENVSVGLGQIQVRRAKELEKEHYIEGITKKEKAQTHIGWLMEDSEDEREWQARIDRLINPEWNIRYVGAYLKYLQDARKPQFPAITSSPDILSTVYNSGKTDAHPNPKPSDYGEDVKKIYPKMKNLI